MNVIFVIVCIAALCTALVLIVAANTEKDLTFAVGAIAVLVLLVLAAISWFVWNDLATGKARYELRDMPDGTRDWTLVYVDSPTTKPAQIGAKP